MPVIATPVDQPEISGQTPIDPGGDNSIGTTVVAGPTMPSFVKDFKRGDGGDRSDECDNECVSTCSQVFINLRALPTIRMGTLVQWDLHPAFADPGPYEYQLQVGRTGVREADDWQPVGLPASNVFYMVDDEQRVYGKDQWTHYRVCLSTPAATYFSEPVSTRGDLSFADRAIFMEMLRAQFTYLRGSDGAPGALLKKRKFGTKCTACRDTLTDDIISSDCEECYGTGFVKGWYDPAPCVWAAVGLMQSHNHQDTDQGGGMRGTIDDGKRPWSRVLAVPQLFEGDIWVDYKNDFRYYIHDIREDATWRGVPVAYMVNFRLLPFSEAAYRIEVPQMLPDELQTV